MLKYFVAVFFCLTTSGSCIPLQMPTTGTPKHPDVRRVYACYKDVIDKTNSQLKVLYAYFKALEELNQSLSIPFDGGQELIDLLTGIHDKISSALEVDLLPHETAFREVMVPLINRLRKTKIDEGIKNGSVRMGDFNVTEIPDAAKNVLSNMVGPFFMLFSMKRAIKKSDG